MLQLISKFANKAEARESKDEVLIGEMVYIMAYQGCPTIGLSAGTDLQYVRFKPVQDPLMHSLTVVLDRKTGDTALQQAVVGSKATLTFVAEVKNYVADPDDLVQMFKTDAANIFRNPWLGDIKLNHQLNSVTATKKQIIDIDKHIGATPESRELLKGLLLGTARELREKLVPYKK
ncbi:hypothetical protein [Spirillospora sp. NPDC047279]|uniref:hypothetical protein n=1 Tax=Spirillospora sp. NPDC047279 TaxID=3155478 RepID=UPI00340D32B3